VGYKIKVDKTNSKIIQEELDRKQEEYLKNEVIKEISEHYKTENVSLNVVARLDIFLVHSHETRELTYS
jgi:predicted transglutaminase-like protease